MSILLDLFFLLYLGLGVVGRGQEICFFVSSGDAGEEHCYAGAGPWTPGLGTCPARPGTDQKNLS